MFGKRAACTQRWWEAFLRRFICCSDLKEEKRLTMRRQHRRKLKKAEEFKQFSELGGKRMMFMLMDQMINNVTGLQEK